MQTNHLIPATDHRVAETIKRSRFIAAAGRASTPEQAKTFISDIKAEFPDATHHCWAFNAGAPGSTDRVGMSDAGEPHGTAGRPMLNVLMHADVGEIVVVVTRYFGGVKLGTGGLVRAYAGMVQKVLASLPKMVKTAFVQGRITCEYADHQAVQNALQGVEAQTVEERFEADVTLDVKVDSARLETFRKQLNALTSGRARLEGGSRE